MVDETGGGSTAGHTLHGRGIELGLGQSEAAVRLDRPDADCAVAPDTRKDDADRALAAVLGQRCEEGIDGPAMLSRRRRRCQPENAILDGQGRIGWDDKDVVLFDRKPILDGHNRNGTVCTEQLHQQALVMRIEVLYQHERHACIGWRTRQKPLEGVQAAG